MLPQDSELEQAVMRLIEAQRQMRQCLDAHLLAMKAMDVSAMREAGKQQEALRRRIAALEEQRKMLAERRGRELRLKAPVTLAAIAKADVRRGAALMKLRNELKTLIEENAHRSHVTARLAEAVLGHLNTAMRLLGGAMQRAGVYTRSGVKPTAGRIGIMEAVG